MKYKARLLPGFLWNTEPDFLKSKMSYKYVSQWSEVSYMNSSAALRYYFILAPLKSKDYTVQRTLVSIRKACNTVSRKQVLKLKYQSLKPRLAIYCPSDLTKPFILLCQCYIYYKMKKLTASLDFVMKNKH